MQKPSSPTCFAPLALAAALLVSAGTASAIERRFTYTYEATTAPKGTIELENWVTWQHRDRVGDDEIDRFRFRHELEFGLTDRLQLGVYLFDWEYNEDNSEGHEARWEHSGFELIYNHTNPTTDLLGSGLYFEALVGEDLVELEGKVLLEKNFGPLKIAYNAIIEAEWEGESLDEKTGEFAQTAGVSYDISKSFSLGAELLHEVEMPDWETTGSGVVFVGPVASVRFGRAFLTATALFQVSHVEGEPDTQLRVISGFHF